MSSVFSAYKILDVVKIAKYDFLVNDSRSMALHLKLAVRIR